MMTSGQGLDRPRYGLAVCALLALAAGTTSVLADDDNQKILDKKAAVRAWGINSPDPWKMQSRRPWTGSGDASFQSKNVNLKSWLPLNNFSGFSAGDNAADCWGYTSPSGREYALVGLSWGNAIVEVTNPASPTIVSVIGGGVNSLWRDITVIGNYAYAVSDSIGVGIQVLNLANVDSGSVTLVRNYAQGGHTETHTLINNPASGFMYACGGNAAGGRAIPVATTPDPTFPTFTGAQSPTNYVHEALAVNYTSGPYAGKEIVFLFTGTAGMEIVDWTNKASPVTLSQGSYPGEQYGHQGWLSEDRKYLYVNDELDSPTSGLVPRFLTRVFDVSDLTAPRLISTITNGLPTVDHNEYTKGRYLYQSNYCSGLRIWDLTNPLKPYEVAWFDSRPDDDGTGYNGAWGNYPYFNSGTVIISDIERGMFAVKMSILEFANTIVYPTTVVPGSPTPISATITGYDGAAIGAVNLKVSINGAPYTSIPMAHQGGGVYAANIPATNSFDRVRYYMQADTTDIPSRPFTWPLNAAGGEVFTAYSQTGQTTLFSDNFETDQGWTVSTTANNGTPTGAWTRAVPIFNGGPGAVIGDADASSRCFVTGNVANQDVDFGAQVLLSPAINLAGFPEARLSYSRWLLSVVSTPDNLLAEVSNNNGASWTTMELLQSPSGAWAKKTLRIADLIAPTAQMRFRFTIGDAPRMNTQGNWVDDSVTEAGIDAFLIVNPVGGTTCYANCDGTGGLTANDFSCFLNAFANGQSYADCDGVGGLTANDFSCFLNAYANGCS
jgi:choice-of-anchor B domain-containing protein